MGVNFMEIYKKMKAEDELSLKAQLLDSASDSIKVLDTDGNILYANEATCKMYGYTKEELLNMSVLNLQRGSNIYDFHMKVKELEENDNIYIECTHVRKDGTEFPVEIHSKAIEADGRIVLLDVSKDIRERKKSEEMSRNMALNLKTLNETLEYDRLKTEFFSNISHELRTPLNVILGSIQLIDLYNKSGLIECKEQTFPTHIANMKKNCYRLLRLLNNLIDITRIDSGYMNLNLTECNIISIIEDITQSVVEYAQSCGLTLIFDTEIEEKVMAIDIEKMERILLNLLSNAIKFTNPGGNITVSVSENDKEVIISVKDTGIGIPEDKINIIFERFRQVDNSLNRSYEGSGIGLSIVKALVKMHYGNIWVNSCPDIGSEFIIKIPSNLTPAKYMLPANKNIQSSHISKTYIELADI